MQSLPDVFKQSRYIRQEGSVKIPDAPEPALPVEQPVSEELDLEQDDEPVQELPPVRFEPVIPTKRELAERYKDEIEEISREAAERAYTDAAAAKKNDVQQCISRVETLLVEMQRVQEEYFEKFSGELKYMAVDIAETLMMTKIENDDLALRDLVMQAMGRIKNADWLDVQLSDKLTGLIEVLRREVKNPEYNGKVSISPKPMPIDSVRVDTQIGAVDATITKQTDRLRDMFAEEAFN